MDCFLKKLGGLKLLLLFGLLSFGKLQAQYVPIPDPYFQLWLVDNGFVLCMDTAYQLDTTCARVLNDTTVDCRSNNIYSLQGIQYFKSLKHLACSFNYLDSLPLLPDSLLTLNCGNNRISHLHNLPPGLQTFMCDVNQLTDIGALPTTLRTLNCDSNQLTSLLDLPDTMNELLCADNPHLVCLPALTTITTLNFTGNAVNCLLTYGHVTNSQPPLNTVPLCDSAVQINCAYTGIKSLTNNLQFKAYPNPVKEVLYLDYIGVENLDIALFNTLGQKLMEQQFEPVINMSHYLSGIYFLAINSSKEHDVVKLVKQ